MKYRLCQLCRMCQLYQLLWCFLQISFFILIVSATTFGQINHDLKVTLHPDSHRLEVVDKITLPPASTSTEPFHFTLHQGLKPEVLYKDTILRKNFGAEAGKFFRNNPSIQSDNVTLELFEVKLPPGINQFTLKYQGEIFHPIKEYGEEYARSFSVSPGIISPEGIFLSGSSFWYPHFVDELVTFSMDVELPKGWSSVNQGARTKRSTSADSQRDVWVMGKPQEEIYLISAEFTEYGQAAGAVDAMAFLRKPDPQLAQKYLDTTAQYLDMYRKLLGPYPYSKFALVENFWETGYGMPSFTLLGPKVIRFPFILHSSYPHEILHNWWGNGVYTDYEKGNWAEGLTTYLADHLIKEQRGTAVEYRRSVLQKYTNYVTANKDFPLSEFRSRRSAVTEAVGYGKTMMLFHMLRQQLGDQVFIKALNQFYRKYKFKVTSFDDIETTFNKVTDDPLALIFEQWVKKAGAPSLRVHKATAKPQGDGYVLSAIIEQTQETEPYRLKLPIAVHLEGVANAFQTSIDVDTKQHHLKRNFPARPVRLDVDPEFDVFRILDHNETPPAISQVFGAEHVLIILPATAPESFLQGYQDLAKVWQKGRSVQLDIKLDNELDELPTDRAVWLFGWENSFRPMINKALSDYDYVDKEKTIHIDSTELKRDQHTVVIMARHPSNSAYALAWLATDNVAAMPGLGRKLPHYNKYSYLGFTGDEPTNVFKGQWPVVNSPMSIAVLQSDDKEVEPTIAKLAPRVSLAQLPPVFSEARMLQDIKYLASDELAGRGLGTAGLDKAADYIAKQFSDAGLRPCGDGPDDYFQIWTEKVDKPERDVTIKNVVGIIPGTNPEWDGQSVVIGAHYDSHGLGWPDVLAGNEGKIHPGADDNASGISVLLELGRLLGKKWQTKRTIMFVAFSAEEAGKLGSLHYVRQAKKYPVSKIMAMINLDTVGQLGQDALIIFGTHSAREWVHIFRGAGYVTGVPIKQSTIDTGNGDEKSFLDAGVPSVHFFSGARDNYHRPTDTVDRIDTAGLVKTAAVLKEVVEYLAARPEPLTSTLIDTKVTPALQKVQPHKRRRVVLGTIPDFGYTGKGVRLDGVTPDSPAYKVGLQEGDIIARIEDTVIEDLQTFSEVLKALQAGSEITVVFMRDNVELSVTTKVVAR
ncbi:MAG: peptidase [Candidatus Scalindua rubra]|uniref:Peptidase n=1 Tax=Candidatus Scalindua rubra TaxID=1872076 RepID=A0A1E3X9R5_9BACT|nr:MAG: peptidase [Candidatus Scalindua rubra]